MSNTPSHPVVHFEIGCRDLEKTTAFYTGIFGWAPTPIPQASLLQTGSPEGIQGHITALGHEPHQYVTFYIHTQDIEDSLRKIGAAGGRTIVGPVPLPDGRKFAWFADPEGNTIGLTT
jgi:predicted enzyme related to lactoylglutathione lyase